MKLPILPVFFLITFFSAAGVRAEDAPETLRLPIADDQLEARKHFYSAFMRETKVGWMSEDFGRRKRDGREVYCLRLETHTSTRAFGAEMKSAEVEEQWFDIEEPYLFVGGLKTAESGDISQRIEVTPAKRRKGGAPFKAKVTGGGKSKVRDWDPGDFQLADTTTATVWFRGGPKVGDAVRVRTITIGNLEVSADTMTVTKAPGGGRNYEATLSNSELGEVGVIKVDAEGEAVEMVVGGGAFTVRREDGELARHIVASEVDMFVDNIIRVDAKLGDVSKVEEMTLKITGSDVQKIPSGPNQTGAFDEESGVMTLSLGRRFSVDSPVVEAERAKALEDTVNYPSEDPAVVKLAKSAVAKAGKSKAKQAEALVKFVDRFIEDVPTVAPMTVSDIISIRSGDCTEHALLFVTMARAIGIPAREISGLYYADEIGGFGGHAWAEVVLDDEWVPVDPAWGQTWTDPAHIRIYTHGVSDLGLQMLQMSGDFKIEIGEIKK